jgi:cell division protein FtsI (penicillin-binding protein 3)
MSMSQVLDYSSNVGSSWVAARLGAAKYYRTLRALGIGQPTRVDLPGETVGLLRDSTAVDWIPFDLATNSYGHGLAVTPLQLASAMATIANGGVHLKPFVVKKVAGPAGTRLYYPTILGQAVRAETAATLSRMLVGVVDDDNVGEGRLARVPGYALAGETGTAELAVSGGSSKTTTVASFLGFGPAENPRFVILVRIDAPRDTPSGETVAAPVFGAIARQLLSYYQIPPSRPLTGSGT